MTASALQRPTLVLNRNWHPIGVLRVVRSLALVYGGVARVVDVETYELLDWTEWLDRPPAADEPFVRGVGLVVKAPEVVALVHCDRLPRTTAPFSRRNVFKRDHFLCQYCGGRPNPGRATIDHVVPKARGGGTTWTNCVLACKECNGRKADRTPDQAGLTLRRRPSQPRWKPWYSAVGRRPASWTRFLPVGETVAVDG
ncbi:MAG: HNH endonuclease [Planctomycetia bacterium]